MTGWLQLEPREGRILLLPEQGVVDGPYLRLPPGRFDAMVLHGLREGLGNPERFFAAAARQLAPGAQLLLDLENVLAPRALHLVLEGRPGAMDPLGSLHEPEQRLTPRRAVQAMEAAGFLVRDVIEAPSAAEEVGEGFVAALFAQGFVATPYLPVPPAARLWIQAEHSQPLEGSVLIGPGPQQERTAGAVRAFLPRGWEVVPCQGEHEAEAFNRGVVRARGRVLWFVRAGAEYDEALFFALQARAAIGPAAPGEGLQLCTPGDLSGLMLARSDALANGPLRRFFAEPAVAYEDWLLRLESFGRRPHGVAGSWRCPPPPVRSRAAFAQEAEFLLETWACLGKGENGHGSENTPGRAGRAVPVAPWQKERRKPRVTLCMIARDEERFLRGCLERVRGAFDEFVLVDTGSTDSTVAIAEEFGAKVVRSEWNDDFAAPRNLGLEHAKGDWVLVLDADEYLEEGSVRRIRELVEDPGASGYHLVFQNVYGEGRTLGVVMVRLFRNLPGLRWRNRIHEQITPSLTALAAPQGLVLALSDVTVLHHGYSEQVIADRGKNERNEKLFRLHLAEHPDDLYMLYKFGDFLRRMPERADEARATLERALELLRGMPPCVARDLPYAGEIAALVALEHARAERFLEADVVLETALRGFMPTPNLHYIAASVALARGRAAEAIAHYQRCLAYEGQTLVVPIQDGITSYVALAGIANARLAMGDRAGAHRLLEQAIALKPEYEPAVLARSRMALEEGDPAAALRVLTQLVAVKPDSVGACQQAYLILARIGLVDQALGMGRRALTLLEQGAHHAEARRLQDHMQALQALSAKEKQQP
ncbi:MAG: glycosyltransferase [Planctomycetes bacterium]|nr:glycosyltransferase [Planctomycetota bacterium]